MSLSQEFKDFMAGYTAVRAIGDAKEDRELKREGQKADTAYKEAMIDIQRQRLDLERERFARAGSGSVGGRGRVKTPEQLEAQKHKRMEAQRLATVAPLSEKKDSSGTAIPDSFTPQEYYQEYFRGGLVFADAAKPIADDLPQVDTASPPHPQMQAPTQSALPAEMPSGGPSGWADPTVARPDTPGVVPPTEQDEAPNARKFTAPKIVLEKSEEAMKAGFAALEAELRRAGPNTEPGGALGGQSATEILDSAGGLGPNEYQELLQKIDPQSLIASQHKSAVLLAEGFQYYQERGEPQKAAQFAMQMLVMQRNMSRVMGRLAYQAMEKGDGDSAAKLIADAANSFPDGHEVSIVPHERDGFLFTIKDEEDKVVSEGRLNSAQFWEQIEGVENGSAFMAQAVNTVALAKDMQEARGGKQQQQPEKADPKQVSAMMAQAGQAQAAINAIGENYKLLTDPNVQTREPTEEELFSLRQDYEAQKALHEQALSFLTEAGISITDIQRGADAYGKSSIPGLAQVGEPVVVRSREDLKKLKPGDKFIAADDPTKTVRIFK